VGLLDPQNLTWDFQMTLEDYLKHLGINNVFNLNHYDFSKVRIVLIPTVPGYVLLANNSLYDVN
jgi:sulfur carrier protein ThiS